MGFSCAHGTQIKWILAALWRLPPFKFGDNPRQVSFTKHARPFQRSTRLHWQPTSPWQTARLAPRLSCRYQAGLVFRPAGLFTFPFSGAATRRSWNHFPTWRGGFCMPRTGGAFTASTNAVPASSTGTAKEVGPLTSSPPCQGQSSG